MSPRERAPYQPPPLPEKGGHSAPVIVLVLIMEAIGLVILGYGILQIVNNGAQTSPAPATAPTPIIPTT